MDVSKFKDVFISEVEDHVQKLNDNLLLLESFMKDKKADKKSLDKKHKDLFDELMRSAHTVKSSAATMGYSKMAFLMHVLEDVFDYARNGLLEIKPEIISELFATIDVLEKSLNSIKDKNVELDVDDFSRKIKKMTGVATESIGASRRDKAGRPVLGVKSEDKDTEASEEPVVLETVVDKVQHIKVPVKRLDDLMDLTEELLIEKMRLNLLIDEAVKKEINLGQVSVLDVLKPSTEHLNNLISSLQYLVMQSRLVPAGQIFARFPRMIRDLSEKTNKEVEFIIKGEDLEMDRSIIDKLGEPLVHLLRNAVDHGIEKSGSVTLEAKRDKDFASIIVEDNGAGIPWTKLVQAAIVRDIITDVHGQELLSLIKNSPQSVWQTVLEKELLYNPRLSTSETVTETSGRGVGTSVVKKFAEEMGGEIIVTSPVSGGKGTRFVLNLPLTLAIIKALLVEINGSIFAIPFSTIERAVFLDPEHIKSVADQDVAVVDDQEVPLVSLEKIFHLIGDANNKMVGKSSNQKPGGKKIAVLVARGAEVAGLLVDRLLTEQEIIVKSLPAILKNTKGFSGSTILGDGDAVLILDVVSFLEDKNRLTRI